ncbi:hypothetical protein JCM3775_002642 [Rhodotorula graminis]
MFHTSASSTLAPSQARIDLVQGALPSSAGRPRRLTPPRPFSTPRGGETGSLNMSTVSLDSRRRVSAGSTAMFTRSLDAVHFNHRR